MATAKNPTDSTKPVKIALNLIKADHALQPRVEMDDEHWNRMARAYVEGDDVPPPIHLFFDGKFYWLVDGFHRYKAMWSIRHMGTKFTHIKAFIHDGTKEDAIIFAAQANLDSRSKPMSDVDRKKAMWMLMSLPEWRGKSATMLGKLFGLSATTSREYWLKYFPFHGLPVPEFVMDGRGRMIPAQLRPRKTFNSPKLCKKNKGTFVASVDGKCVHLGTDHEKAKQALSEAMEKSEAARSAYEISGRIKQTLTGNCIDSEQIYVDTCRIRGLYARSTNGIAFTWESFRDKTQVPAAYARACHARFVSGASRAVVLCPVEDGPADLIEDFRRMGVEWMTIEDFVASLKGDGPGDSA